MESKKQTSKLLDTGNRLVAVRGIGETVSDLGPFAAVHAPGQNTKKLYRTKNSCEHVQFGQTEQDTKRPKTQLPLLRSWGQKQGTAHAPCTQCHQGVGKHLNHSSGPTTEPVPILRTCPYPPSIKGTSSHTIPGSKQGKLFLVFTLLCCSRGPSKALPESLVWPLLNFP